MERTKVTNEDLKKIKEFIEQIRFGSVTVIVQEGKVIQIEKHEKVRLNS
ncbi:MAG: YezD family protein [Schaedlerella sp.]|nr:YezD family protein [Lachnospiraceae bacterium]MDY4203192.1 YezD family protein [Schaedlerella sp.]